MATEWIVEAKEGGTCVVRVVHSLFADSDDWDGQLESMESGWPTFFGILKLYMTHFRGESCSIMRAMGAGQGTEADVWSALVTALGTADVAEGQRFRTATQSAPPLAGIVESVHRTSPFRTLLRIDEPSAGVASLSSFTMNDQPHVLVAVYLYGDTAQSVADREGPRWQSWLAEAIIPGCQGQRSDSSESTSATTET